MVVKQEGHHPGSTHIEKKNHRCCFFSINQLKLIFISIFLRWLKRGPLNYTSNVASGPEKTESLVHLKVSSAGCVKKNLVPASHVDSGRPLFSAVALRNRWTPQPQMFLFILSKDLRTLGKFLVEKSQKSIVLFRSCWKRNIIDLRSNFLTGHTFRSTKYRSPICIFSGVRSVWEHSLSV